jgi:hypothetical protein
MGINRVFGNGNGHGGLHFGRESNTSADMLRRRLRAGLDRQRKLANRIRHARKLLGELRADAIQKISSGETAIWAKQLVRNLQMIDDVLERDA